MRIGLFIAAIVLIVFGAIWALQGLSIIGGSFMVGQTRWLYIGLRLRSWPVLVFSSLRERNDPRKIAVKAAFTRTSSGFVLWRLVGSGGNGRLSFYDCIDYYC